MALDQNPTAASTATSKVLCCCPVVIESLLVELGNVKS